MTTIGLLYLVLAPLPDDGGSSAADVVALRGGGELRGQVERKAPRGWTSVVARRAWVKKHLPDRFDAWQQAEAKDWARARGPFLKKLQEWRRERARSADRDPIAEWIDAEIKRLGADVPDAPLMRVRLKPSEIERTARAEAESGQLLRLGWKAGLEDPEGLTAGDLKSALEAVGVAAGQGTDATLVGLLPAGGESESAFASRRAATEVAHDRGAKLIRFGSLVMPDSGEGGIPAAGPGLAAKLLGDLTKSSDGGDPLAPELAKLAGRGEAGALVTEMAIAEDLSRVRVEIRLLVREGNRWRVAGSRAGEQETDKVDERLRKAVGEDPQIRAAFRVVEGLGLGQLGEDAKRRALGVGTAARIALSKARNAAQEDLDRLAFPVGRDR